MWATTGTGGAKWFWSPVGVGLTTGVTQLIYDGEFEPETFLKILEDEGVTKLCTVPTQYRMFANADLESYDVQLNDTLSAGDPLNREPIERIEDGWDVMPRDSYGQTETVALVTNYPGIDVKPGSMGKPTPGVGATIIDVDEEVEAGEIGEIEVPVDSPAIFGGYYEKPELDEQKLSGDYYRTGDLTSRTRTATSSSKNGPTTSSSRRATGLVPSKSRTRSSATTPSPRPPLSTVRTTSGEALSRLTSSSQRTTGGSEDFKDELQEVIKEETAPYKCPRRIEFVDELPKTSSRKIRRAELRQQEQEKHA